MDQSVSSNKNNSTRFDMEEYVKKRMMEMKHLEDRVLYKDIVGNLLLKLYNYTADAYEELEERLVSEDHSKQAEYAIYMTLTNKFKYDATDTFMYPMLEKDIQERSISFDTIKSEMEINGKVNLYTIFLKLPYSQIHTLLEEEKLFTGIIKTEQGEYQGNFCLSVNQEYMSLIEELHNVFAINCKSWTTVCVAYLTKMMHVILCSIEGKEDMGLIQNIKVDFGEYADAVEYDMIPLWNLKSIKETTNSYPEPSIDKTNYEHLIFSHRLEPDCGYLVQNTEVEITNIRWLNGDMIITCPLNSPHDWKIYQVNKKVEGIRYPYPILSNRYKESFVGSMAELFKKSVKTKAELARLVESFAYGSYVKLGELQLVDHPPTGYDQYSYQMDEFIVDEIRVGNSRQALMIDFHPVKEGYFLNEDIISFLVTQVQKIFPEYFCIGTMNQQEEFG